MLFISKLYCHVAQDVQPLIESMDLEHSFMHELSGHLEQFGEERRDRTMLNWSASVGASSVSC